jgi:DNA-binding Lrp family transcriptional regulator
MTVRGYVLIQTEVGRAAAVSELAGAIEGVIGADNVTGPYDVIVQAESGTVDDLGRLVVARIQTIPGITRTVTCPVVRL